MNIKNMPEGKFFELLNKLPLSEAERGAALSYLEERAGHEVLDSFTFEDLSAIPADPAIRLFRELVKTNQHELAAKLVSVLLAKGDSTCYRMIPMTGLDPQKGAVDLETDSAKKAAVYAAILGADLYPLDSYSRDRLVDIACGKAEILKQAVDFEKNKSSDGRFVLCAVYFMRKYKCGDGKEKPVEEEDAPLLAQYEELAIESLDRLFPSYHPSVAEIKDAIRNGGVTKHILELAVSKRGVTKQVLRLTGSMAYLNYPLSGKLKDIVKICLAAELNETLDAINLIGLVTPMDIYTRGVAYDKEFELESEKYIAWAAKMGHTLILEKQFTDNFEAYVRAMDEAEIEVANKMFAIINKKNPPLYEELLEKRKQYGRSKEMDKMLNKLVHNDKDAAVIRAYLSGETAVSTLYPIADALGKNYSYGGGREMRIFEGYDKRLLGGAFYRRFQTYMWLRHGMWFLRNDLIEYPDPNRPSHPCISAEKVEKLFWDFSYEGLDITRQLNGVEVMEQNIYALGEDIFHAAVVNVFSRYLKDRREDTIRTFAESGALGRLFGLEVYSRDVRENKAEILAYAEDGTKKVKQALFAILCAQKGWEEEVKGLLASKKAAVRELAIRVLAYWQESGADYCELLSKVLEKEKNVKIREILSDILVKDGGASAGKSLSQKEMVQEIHKGGRKRSLAWAYETPFSPVHTAGGELAEEEYLQAILLCYSSMEKCGCNKNAEFLAKALHAGEFAVYVNELFDKWLSAGAEAKKRWVLYAASIHGGDEIIVRLQRQIKEWPKQARGAIACEAVKALALNPLPQALLAVDGIARKFKYQQVRSAADGALEFAAKQLGVSREELADRIVPDLGFDEEYGRSFDYGERKFRVMITPAMEIEVFEEVESKEQDVAGHVLGKKLKNLPAPGKKDDPEKAAAAYEEFKQIKKQIKVVAASQKLRLEEALSSARLWSVRAWKRLFVKNPIMHQFAIGLIWGVYEDGKLVQSFRYMEDGSFNTQDGEEYFLPGEEDSERAQSGGLLGLVHPVELAETEREAWKEQLEDYEITQPFMQMDRPIYTPEEAEFSQRKLSRFSGRVITDISLGSRLLALGWYRGPVLDGGCFDMYYREDKDIGLGAQLHFSGSFVSYLNEDVEIHSLRFYKIGEIEQGYCAHWDKDDKKSCFLGDVPAKYFSEIVMQIEKATAGA